MRPRRLVPLLPAIFGILACTVLVWAELLHWRASRRGLHAVTTPPMREAVVVLGFRNRGTRANAVNRYRVRAGLRSFDPDAAESVLVLCGGGVASVVPEAELMARYARRRGYTGPILLESESRTTEENIRNVVELIEDCDAVRIVSNSLHAETGRALLRQRRPDLAERLRPAREHRFGEVVVMKSYAAFRALHRRRRAPG